MSITFAHCLRNFCPSKKIRIRFIFCVFASVACILIGKDGEYEKTEKKHEKIWTQCAMAFSLQLILNRLQQTCMIQRAVCWFFLKCMFIYFFRDWADDKIMWENGKTFLRVKVWSHLLLLDKISWVKRRCCHNFASNLSKRTCILLDKIIYSCILLIKKYCRQCM